MKRRSVLVLVAACLSAAAEDRSAAAYARAVQAAGLDADACFRVRDLSFQKDDLRFYLTDGRLIFSKPVEGRRLGALFTADVPGGDAEVLLFPPHRSERLSLSAFANTPNLNEHFTAALFLFTDGTGEQLLKEIESRGAKRDPEGASLLLSHHNDTLRNISSSYEVRIVQDRFTGNPEENGFFYATVSGRKLGTFDLLYDPRARDQILVGQLAYRENRRYFDTWTSFEGRSFRSGRRQRKPPAIVVGDVHIDATLAPPDLQMKAVTRVRIDAIAAGDSTVAFELSRRMKVTEARVDGQPAEVFSRESIRTSAVRASENELFLVMLPKELAKGESHTLEIAHEGTVVAAAGNGVYYVGARTTWYPHRDAEFARYELVFRHPRTLNLVATGELVDEKTDGEFRIATHRTSAPIRFAGFNLGDYRKTRDVRAGITLEVYANQKLEAALQPRPRELIVMPQPPFPSRGGRRAADAIPLPQAASAPNPASRLTELTSEMGAALEFMVRHFGPPPLKTLTVSPIPGMFGQGFPGLVYLSTLAYLNPLDRPAASQSEYQKAFFSELLHAHEAAHQWWGNLVTSASYQDDWIMEALANYSAMMVLESRKGRRALDSVLADYRANLLARHGESTVESAGPIIWGTRLISSQTASTWRTITYEKGSWIIHMLRTRLGDERFLKMLGELARRKRFQPVTTEEFRDIAASFLPPRSEDPKLEEFFEQWVYGTGVPTLKFTYTVQGKAPSVRVRGTVTQSDVPDDFSALAPVEIALPGRQTVVRWIRTSSEPVPFTVDLKQAPVRVTFDPANAVLSRR